MNPKQENFKKIAEARTNKILNLISLLGNLTNTSYYEYTDEQIEHIFDAIEGELAKQKKKFKKKSGTGSKKFELWFTRYLNALLIIIISPTTC